MGGNIWAVGAVRLLMIKKHTNMNAKEFLAQKGVYNLDTKKRYNEVITWMEEYAALCQLHVIKSLPEYNEILYHAKTLSDEQFREYWNEVQGNVL